MSPFVGTMVRFLEKSLPAPQPSITEPRYLNNSITGFPETLVVSVRNEVLHLYENAYEIFAHGINLHRTVIDSQDDLEIETSRSKEIIQLDVDEKYTTGVKSLHSAIIEFTGMAQTKLDPEFSSHLYDLRRASQRIVQAVKDTKHLQKNIDRFIGSDNKAIRREYNTIRVKIARILRLIEKLRTGDAEADVFDLDENKLSAKESRDATIKDLDKMIRKGKITAEMATSLMNDLTYSKTIIRDLTRAGKILFSDWNMALRDMEALMELEDEEIHELTGREEKPEGNVSPAG